MKYRSGFYLLLIFLFFVCFTVSASAGSYWKAGWIAPSFQNDSAGTRLGFRKNFTIDKIPAKAITSIAVDAKYRLWINSKMVPSERGLMGLSF